jgi:pyruvate, orthophosphate dikinase
MTLMTVPGSLVTTHRIYAFDHQHEISHDELTRLLGGKGAGLWEMSRVLGLPVPPGFTIPVQVCLEHLQSGWPVQLEVDLIAAVEALGDSMGRSFGDPRDPLLVAVRSGAPISMPGMLDTVLNLGLNDECVVGLARVSGDKRFAWDSYRRFLELYGSIVMGVPDDVMHSSEPHETIEQLQRRVAELKTQIKGYAGEAVPSDPLEQLFGAVRAVFDSWNSERAAHYREREGISPTHGTAVNVQAMVFGNRGDNSGTGVVFTRNPNTGTPEPYGDYLANAQGEDVVSGSAATLRVEALKETQPAIHDQLVSTLAKLEGHYRDMCEVEFTVENGRLWMLQTRVAKRSAMAAVRIAVDMVDDDKIQLSPAEAVKRVPDVTRQLAAKQFAAAREGQAEHESRTPLTQGLGASPGIVSGRVVLSTKAAMAMSQTLDVILIRPETDPRDVRGMSASVGVLTSRGGLASHAAVVARGWGIPAVVGATELKVSERSVEVNGCVLKEGDPITIDGSTGKVWRGIASAPNSNAETVEYLELARLEAWANGGRSGNE